MQMEAGFRPNWFAQGSTQSVSGLLSANYAATGENLKNGQILNFSLKSKEI